MPDRPELREPGPWAIAETVRIVKETVRGSGIKVCLFGSRARGTGQPFSDLDVGLDADGKRVPAALVAALRERLEESCIPFHVDLVDLAVVPESWKRGLLEEGVTWIA